MAGVNAVFLRDLCGFSLFFVGETAKLMIQISASFPSPFLPTEHASRGLRRQNRENLCFLESGPYFRMDLERLLLYNLYSYAFGPRREEQ